MDGADLVNPSKSPSVVPQLDPEVIKRMQNDPRVQMMRQQMEQFQQARDGNRPGCQCSAGDVLKKYAIGALIGIGIGVLVYYRFASGSKASGGALADGASAE